MRRGLRLLRHSSTVQNVIGLSCAESEYYAHTKGGCSGLATQFVKVATESSPADMLTNALGRSKVEEFCAEIG